MERSLLPIFAILIGAGILLGLILNFIFDIQAKSEIRGALEETIDLVNTGNQAALLERINPPELRIFDVIPPQIIKEREATARKMLDVLSQDTYALKGFSILRNNQRIGMSLSVDLMAQQNQEEANYIFIAINHQTQYGDYHWLLANLLIEPSRKQISEELTRQVDIEKRKRNKIQANIRQHINTGVNKISRLVGENKKDDFLEWVTFDRDVLVPVTLEARKAGALKIFDDLQGSKLAVDQIYHYATEKETGQIVRIRLKEQPPEPIDEEKLSSGWTGTSKTLISLTGLFLLAGFMFMFFKKSTVVRNAVLVLFLLTVLLSGLTIYSKEREKAKHTPYKNYQVADILFLEVMNRAQQIDWVPVQTVGIKDTRTLKAVVDQEFQKRAERCGFKMPD